MTSPTLISREMLNGRIFEKSRAFFVTPRGGCGVRYIHTIDRIRVAKPAWETAWRAAYFAQHGNAGPKELAKRLALRFAVR